MLLLDSMGLQEITTTEVSITYAEVLYRKIDCRANASVARCPLLCSLGNAVQLQVLLEFETRLDRRGFVDEPTDIESGLRAPSLRKSREF